jgi:hypothetical protein
MHAPSPSRTRVSRRPLHAAPPLPTWGACRAAHPAPRRGSASRAAGGAATATSCLSSGDASAAAAGGGCGSGGVAAAPGTLRGRREERSWSHCMVGVRCMGLHGVAGGSGQQEGWRLERGGGGNITVWLSPFRGWMASPGGAVPSSAERVALWCRPIAARARERRCQAAETPPRRPARRQKARGCRAPPGDGTGRRRHRCRRARQKRRRRCGPQRPTRADASGMPSLQRGRAELTPVPHTTNLMDPIVT